MKEFILKYKVAIAVVVMIILFVALSVLIEDVSNKNKIPMKSNIEEWLTDTKSDEYTVTVVAQTTCGHCIAFKPVMQKVLNEYDFNTYWFEVDTISTDSYQTLIKTYELTGYQGTPYTFITKNGEFVDYLSGGRDEETLVEFLQKNNVINKES